MHLHFLWIMLIVATNSLVSAQNSVALRNGEVRKEIVCPSIDVRNQIVAFEQLANCTVIEGSLQILLIEHAEASAYDTLFFPNLVEITDYLLLYRVYGLRTLSHIFPNLSVIRGQQLFFNYALVIFEMPSFENLGLSSLTRIVRGAVRIEKNSALCYLNTVNWQWVTAVKPEDHFIMENRDNMVGECVNLCPKGHSKQPQCPTMEIRYDNGVVYHQPLCWDMNHCQKECPASCGRRPCYSQWTGRQNETRCCHGECIGGCTGPSTSQCTACQHVFYNGQCQRRCPVGTYEYRTRRCLSETECKSLHVGDIRYFKVLDDGHCVQECPSGYVEDKTDKNKCRKCDGLCPKICSGISIDSVAAAQYLKGCTVIDGLLDIQIRGGNHIGRELEENLGQIEEITHHLKIVRSYALLSLRFLKNLRIIHGQALANKRYAMVVFDNQNLQDIWDFQTHPNLTIAKGHLFFHYNRKLCYNKIEELVEHVGNGSIPDEKDIARDTNGDQITCETMSIRVEIARTTSTFAVLSWTNFRTADSREILSWVINYREVKEENATIFGARDACGNDEWQTSDVRPDNDLHAESIASFIHNLKPFTKYALYVQTYTIATASRGALSKIIYFTTDPEVPTPPREVKVIVSDKNELTVNWKAPSSPNGNVTHYYVYWQPLALKAEVFDRRDYCVDKLQLFGRQRDWEKQEDETEEKKANVSQPVDGQCCACPKSQDDLRLEEEGRAFQIEFENFLHDSVYIKSYADSEEKQPWENLGSEEQIPEGLAGKFSPATTSPTNRSKRKARHRRSNVLPKDFVNQLNETYRQSFLKLNLTRYDEDEEQEERQVLPYEAAVVYNDLQLTLTNLQHFQEYSIEVIACHDFAEDSAGKRCSNRAIAVARTLPSVTADTMDASNITVTNHTQEQRALIKWYDPPQPNGIVLTYELELRLVDVPDHRPMSLCIPHKKFRLQQGYLTDHLEPGNWTYRLRAMSLAGNGSYTPALYFYIPHLAAGASTNTGLIAGICTFAALLLLIFVACSAYFVAKKRMDPHVPAGEFMASVNPEYWSPSNVYVQDEWEVPRDKIQLIRELGKGSFGMVYEGIAQDIVEGIAEVKVAVKTVNGNDSIHDRIEFLNEASVMKAFKCHHVVRLLGVVSQGQPTLVIMELMAEGDLKSYLRSHRPDNEDNPGRKPPCLKQILQMAAEIADGMSYLAAKKFVHRDLAARNCMVSEELVCKIGDFGMTRDIYETDYYRKGGKGLLPVRWMAPESLKDGTFTSKSDVWSYGVVMWEMATLAAQPYPGFSNEEVLHYVTDGGILDKPEGCPKKLYDLMLQCWRSSLKQRPGFDQIIEMLADDLNERFREESYHYSAEHHEDLHPTTPEVTEMADEAVEMCTPLARGVGPREGGGDPVEMQPLRGSDDDEEVSSSSSSVCSSYQSQPSSNCSRHESPGCHCVDIAKDNADKSRLSPMLKGGRNGIRDDWRGWPQSGPSPTATPQAPGPKPAAASEAPLLNGHIPHHAATAQC